MLALKQFIQSYKNEKKNDYDKRIAALTSILTKPISVIVSKAILKALAG